MAGIASALEQIPHLLQKQLYASVELLVRIDESISYACEPSRAAASEACCVSCACLCVCRLSPPPLFGPCALLVSLFPHTTHRAFVSRLIVISMHICNVRLSSAHLSPRVCVLRLIVMGCIRFRYSLTQAD